MDDNPISPKHRALVDAYLIELNWKNAARAVGLSYDYVRRLINKPHIIEAVEQATTARSKRTEIDQDAVVNELAEIALHKAGNYFKMTKDGIEPKDWNELTPEQRIVFLGGDVNQKTSDKLKALEMLGKHLDMFTERHEHSGPSGGPIEIASDVELARRIAFTLSKAKNEIEAAKTA